MAREPLSQRDEQSDEPKRRIGRFLKSTFFAAAGLSVALCREGHYQMALVDDGMPCAICGEPIASVSSGKIFATTYFGIKHPDFRVLDDAAAHRECMARWELRDAFVAYYNTHCRNELRVDKNGDVRYRTSLFELITQTPIAYIATPILLPIVGWSNIVGKS